jgi:1,4-dihydroxy-2-naphthoate octaprenyltransferase
VASRRQQRIDPNKVAKTLDEQRDGATREVDGVERTRTKSPDAGATTKAKAKSGRPGGRPPTAPKVRKATAGDWIAGARLRTLSLSVAPVILGTACAHATRTDWKWLQIVLALVVSIALQIGVNYANDYSDGVRGTDKYRVGPARLTGSGAAKPRTVLTVALVFFAIGGVAGVLLAVSVAQYWLIAVGAVCVVAAYFYTGGKRPYGYYGLGELFVFVFFGLVATLGTTFVQLGYLNAESYLCAVAIGLIACAVLMVNNIRDRPQDKIAGKRTLAVLIGELPSRITFVVMVLAPFVILVYFALVYQNAYFTYFLLLLALPVSLITLTARTPRELILALKLTSLLALLFSLALGWAIAF